MTIRLRDALNQQSTLLTDTGVADTIVLLDGTSIRKIAPSDLKVEWAKVQNKPTSFPPEAHNHDTLYDPIGSASSTMATHIANPDPHTQYLQEGEDVNYIDLITNPTIPGRQTGRMYWDNTDKTLALDMEGSSVTMQVGQEQIIRVVNKTGSALLNGTVVSVTSAQGQRPVIAKTDINNSALALATIGLLTEDIPNNGEGYVTIMGIVREVNTSAFLEGDTLFVSESTPGTFTNVEPTVGKYHIRIGTVLYSHATQGKICVRPFILPKVGDLSDTDTTVTSGDTLIHDGTAYRTENFNTAVANSPFAVNVTNIWNDGKYPSGLITRQDNTLSFDSGTRIFTIAPTGTNFSFYIAGTRYTKTSTQVTIGTSIGLHFIYFNSVGTLIATTAPWDITSNIAMVATVYWNGTSGVVEDERHGLRDKFWHKWAHDTVGTRYESGLTGTFTNTTLAITSGAYHDEDIEFNIDAQSTCRQWYRNVGGATFTFDAPSTTYYKTNAGVLQYDNNGTLTNVGNAKYTISWIYVTNDIVSPIAAIIGGQEYNTIADARAASPVAPHVNFPNIPSNELKLLYKVILQNSGGTPTFIEATDFRTASSIPASNYVATDHGTLTGLIDKDHPFNAIQEVNIVSPSAGEVLQFNGTSWVDGPVVSTTPAANQIPQIDSTNKLTLDQLTTTGETSLRNGAVFIKGTTGQIGINTTNPLYDVDIQYGFTRMAKGTAGTIASTVVENDIGIGIQYGVRGSSIISPNEAFIQTSAGTSTLDIKTMELTTPIKFYNGGVEGARFINNNLLLGTTTNTNNARLKVSGDLEISGKFTSTDLAISLINAIRPSLQTTTSNSSTILHLMPKGTPSAGLTSGIKLFATDYSLDSINYADFDLYVTNQFCFINSKGNGAVAYKPIVISYNDTNYIARFDSNGVRIGDNAQATEKLDVIGNAKVSGTLAVNGSTIHLNYVSSGYNRNIYGSTNGSYRWGMRLGNSSVESGSNAGSDFELNRYDDAGSYIESVVYVRRNNGKVGIGTVPSVEKLEVAGNIKAINNSSLIMAPFTTTQGLFNGYASAAGTYILDISAVPYTGSDAASIRLFRSTSTTGTTALRILKGDGSTTENHILTGNANTFLCANNGNIRIGDNTTPTEKLEVAGNVKAAGIKLGTSATPLTAYDEGSWTPVLVGTTTAGSHTYSAREGRWTRIGRVVYISFRITLTTKDAAMAGSVVIQGLPFLVPASPTTQHAANIAFIQNVNYLTTAGNFLTAGFSANTGNITIYINRANQPVAFLDAATITNTTDIAISGFYII